MGVVGGGDKHGVDFVGHLIEHLTEIREGAGGRVGRLRSLCVSALQVDIAERDDIAVAGAVEGFELTFALVAYADHG